MKRHPSDPPMSALPDAPAQGEERRGGRRVTFRARVLAVGALGGEGRSVNLSPGGMYLQRFSGEPLRCGDVLDLVVDLPVGSIRARGEVVGETSEVFFDGVAVAFTRMSLTDRARLAGFVGGRRCAPPRGAILGRVPLERRAAG